MTENRAWWVWRSFWTGCITMIAFAAALGLLINGRTDVALVFFIIGAVMMVASVVMYLKFTEGEQGKEEE